MTILGLSVAAFTLAHVVISLIAIFSGVVVVVAMCRNAHSEFWTNLFLVTTIILTSATGFLFHSENCGPPHVVGVISLCLLVGAVLARTYRLFVMPHAEALPQPTGR